MLSLPLTRKGSGVLVLNTHWWSFHFIVVHSIQCRIGLDWEICPILLLKVSSFTTFPRIKVANLSEMASAMVEDSNFEDDQLSSMTTDDIVRASRLLDNEIRILKVLPFFFFLYQSCLYKFWWPTLTLCPLIDFFP